MTHVTTPLLLRASVRYFLGHPWMTFLAIVGIALGVAVVTAVDLANQGAMQAMRLSVAALSGKTTHRLIGPPGGLDEAIFGPLRWLEGVEQAAPIIDGQVLWHAQPEQKLHVLGVDLLADAPLRPHWVNQAAGIDLKSLITTPGAVLLAKETANHLGLRVNDTLTVLALGKSRQLTVIGLLDDADPLIRQGLRDTLVVDVATAQELLDYYGHLTRIDIRLREGAALPRIPDNYRWVAMEHRSQTLESLTQSFRLNLSVLSMMALMVGMFIIFNTITFSVVRRRHLIGLLRAQGITRAELLRQLLLDGCLLGIPGTLLGLLLGIALGKGLLILVVRTINDLYFGLEVTGMPLDPLALLKGGLLGLGASLVATWPAAWEAVAIAPSSALTRSSLENATAQGVIRVGRWGVGMVGVGMLVVALPGNHLLAGFIALGFFTCGAAMIVPMLMVALVRLLQPGMRRYGGWMGTLALGSVPRHLSRTGIAVAALTVAVATVVGMGLLVDSFRLTVERWLEETLSSDIYVSTGETSTGAGVDVGILDAQLIATLSHIPGVASVGLGRRVGLDTPEGMINLFVLDVDWSRFADRWFLAGNAKDSWPQFQHGDAILISESLAFRRNLTVGSQLALPTPTGEHHLTIGGIYADFRADTGSVTISRNTFANYWRDNAMATMGIRVQPGADIDDVLERLKQAAGPQNTLDFQSNRGLKEASLQIFDRTFAVTRVLRLVSVVVAFFGIWTALMAIQLERTRELAVFRALGMTTDELFRMSLLETGIMGGIAGLLAMPMGWGLGWVLIHVINYRSFGWSLHMDTRAAIVLQALLIAIPTAIAAGTLPARKMARTPPLEALRENL
ncbi:MAG: ABC transporter permease [Magnetococcales bacterium]|nr:ABC transporter permease [Magnetococcales bacterium]